MNFPVTRPVNLGHQAALARRLYGQPQPACRRKEKIGCYRAEVKAAETTLPTIKRRRKCSPVRIKC